MDPLWHTHIVPLHLGCRGGVSPLSPLSQGRRMHVVKGDKWGCVYSSFLHLIQEISSNGTEHHRTNDVFLLLHEHCSCIEPWIGRRRSTGAGCSAESRSCQLRDSPLPQGSLLPPPHCSSSSEAALQHCRFGFFLYAAWLLDAPGLQSCIPVCCHNLGWIFLPMEGLAERLQQGSEQPSPLVRVCSMHLQPREQHPHPSSRRHAT